VPEVQDTLQKMSRNLLTVTEKFLLSIVVVKSFIYTCRRGREGHCGVLYCTVLTCNVQHSTVLFCTALNCTVQYWTAQFYTVQYCTVHPSILRLIPPIRG
jgi:hypothetical protein